METLLKAYRERRLMLFVGAGVSMSLGLPSWRSLIDHIASELGYDPDIYRTMGDPLALAEYYRISTGHIGPLRSWMDVAWHSSPKKRIEDSAVHQLIASSNFDLIYTTNYDRWIEESLTLQGKPFSKIVSAGDLSKVHAGKTQIVKYHGDFTDDNSIVLDETSYYQRFEFESPLDIKLRSDLLSHAVLFIGYSLTDVNVRYMLFKLNELWKKAGPSATRPASFLFSPQENPVQKAVLGQWGVNMISSEIDDPEAALLAFLQKVTGLVN